MRLIFHKMIGLFTGNSVSAKFMMIGFLAAFVLLGPFLYFGYLIYKNKDVNLPGPTPYPFFGIKIPKDIYGVFDMYSEFTQKYGKTFKMYLGGTLHVVTTDAKFLEDLLKSNIHIKKSHLYDMTRPWIGDGLLNSSGTKWKKRRKMLTPSVHFSVVASYLPIFKKSAEILVQRIYRELENGPDIDIHSFIPPFTLDIVGATSFGYDFGCQEGRHHDFLNAVEDFTKILWSRNFSLWQRNNTLFKLFSKNYPVFKKNLDVILNLSSRVIKNKREYYEKYGKTQETEITEDSCYKKKVDLIAALLQHSDLSDSDIQMEVNTFLFGGNDTVATSLSFALYELGNRPDIQEELYEEIKLYYEMDPDMSIETLQSMPYLNKVIKETLRLRTTVPIIERLLEQDAIIGGLNLPKGTVITIALYWLHHNSEYYPNPEEFDPERFDPDNDKKRPNYSHLPFSAGPKNCIGQKYGMVELMTAISRILREFEILPVPGHKLVLGTALVLKSKYGLPIRFKPRNKN